MKRFLLVTLILPAMLLMFNLGCESDDPEEPYPPPNVDHNFGQMTDTRDNQTYQTIEIGTQTWMAQNLNYETGNSWCYENNPNNCDTYGRLYDWNTAKQACPSGWHLPSDTEWTTLTNFLGGNAGGKMKSTCGLWKSLNRDATNSSGWSGLPGGCRYLYGLFYYLGSNGYWWSASEFDADCAWYRSLSYDYGDVFRRDCNKEVGFSVRCLRN